MLRESFFERTGGLHSKWTMAGRVALSVQVSQDQQNNSVQHPETVSLLTRLSLRGYGVLVSPTLLSSAMHDMQLQDLPGASHRRRKNAQKWRISEALYIQDGYSCYFQGVNLTPKLE